jgi:hypothetical protein
MEDLFERVCDRTRSRLDIPALRRLFGLYARPHHNRKSGPPAQEIVIGKPRYGLTWFRISFGLLQLKAYTKGEHVLRFEATVHNTKERRCRRGLDNFDQIITRLAGMADRFATTLDCADTSFLPDGILDQLPLPSQLGATRTGGIDLNKPRIRAALAAALALAAASRGFTVAEFTAKVADMHGQASYTTRQAAYDLRKLRGKSLAIKPGRSRSYLVPPQAARTIAALLALRDHVIGPSSPEYAARVWAASPPSGPLLTAGTRRCGSACRTSSTTSASSLQPHRQHFVDHEMPSGLAAYPRSQRPSAVIRWLAGNEAFQFDHLPDASRIRASGSQEPAVGTERYRRDRPGMRRPRHLAAGCEFP